MTTVAAFDAGVAPDRATHGGKGAGLIAMVERGLPVPPGFIVGTDAGRAFLTTGTLPDVEPELAALEARMQRRLGDPGAPLFVSVRSGAPVSMPGMMDTVLNVGLNDEIVVALARLTDDEHFAWSSYERLLHTFATTVRDLPAPEVEDALFDAAPGPRGAVAGLLELLAATGAPFPQDPREQVRECLQAVFGSWESPRARAYREHRGIDASLGTAAVVQAMVFGNRGADSASGVAFSRDPATGAPGEYGDVLFDAQGEDVVAGTADPLGIEQLDAHLPEVAHALRDALAVLERDERDLVECEFTIEEGRLWILQYRRAQRSGRAAVRVAVDLVDEGILAPHEAAALVTDEQLASARAPQFASAANDVLARGHAASPGAALGAAVFDAGRAKARADAGDDVILVRPTTSPADIHGFIAARGIVTGRGGRTSHAAVVARGLDRPAVCGVGEVVIAPGGASATIAGVEVREGDVLAVDGDRGLVARTAPPLGDASSDERLARLESWRAA